MPLDPRFLAESGREIFNGNELLIKGTLETEGGVHLLTGYPGSPVSGFFDILGDIRQVLVEHGVRAFQANNEALAAAALNGSQMLPCRAMAVMKSVGVHVAADALALANLAGTHAQGGAMVIMGDDPWCESTQVPADSRFICQHLRMPVVEPGWPQQIKDWIDASFKLSNAAGLYIGYIVTTGQIDGGGTVLCRPNHFPAINTLAKRTLESAQVDLGKVLLPPRTWQRELGIPERFAATMAAARRLGVNAILPATRPLVGVPSPLGFVVTGSGGPYLRHVLADLGLDGVFPVLQMGMSYPVDMELVAEFSRHCGDIIVIEERRSFLEQNIRDGLRQLDHQEAVDISARLYGKQFPAAGRAEEARAGIPDTRGLNPSVLALALIPLLQRCQPLPAELRNGRLSAALERLRSASRVKLEVASEKIVVRTPTFCPGCPHRDSSATLLELRKDLADPAYMRRVHKRGPVDLIAHGDTGCYTMLMFAPTEQLMHNYSGMGLGAGTGSGIDAFITNKQIVFMGDSTFFHSGQIAISNAVKAGQDITFIILENGTTAMTGHQEHPGTELDVLGNLSPMQDIQSIVAAMAGTSTLKVTKLSPAQRDRYRQVLEKNILADGVKVIIADKECGITHQRQVLRQERQIVRQKGYLPHKTHMNVTPEVCENCLECTRQTSCPGLTILETDYGPKIDTDLTWCVNDGACERVRISNEFGYSIKPCPSFEEVTIVRGRRKRYTLPKMELDQLPEATALHDMSQPGATWRAHMAGVGGMGIGVATAILVRAGHKEGYRVVFSDKKGLAIRNGGVYSQVTFVRQAADASESASAHVPPTSGQIPYGQADLLLGIDILEAARAIDPREQFRVAHPQRTAAVLNLHKQPTVYALLGRQDFDPAKLQHNVLEHCHPERWFAKNLSELCERRLGSKQFANIMLLGVAYQLGLIPVSFHAIAWAIRDSIPREHRKNLKAFNIGRKLALEPRTLPDRPEPRTWQQLLRNKVRILEKTRWRARVWVKRLEDLVQQAMASMPALSDEAAYDLTLRLYDILQYQDHRLAADYLARVQHIYGGDSAEHGFAATHAAILSLAKVILIKDEPYVAYLLTRFEKKQRDLQKYNVDHANGERLVYRHCTKPELNIGPWRLRLNLHTRDWQLKLVSRCKWLRKLPRWHQREQQFRDWFLQRVQGLAVQPMDYPSLVAALRAPLEVKGYREVRYPAMEQCRRTVEALLRQMAPAGRQLAMSSR